MKSLLKWLLFLSILPVCLCQAQIASTKKLSTLTARYDLNIHLSPAAHFLEANGTILLPPEKNSRETVKLGLDKVFGKLQVEVLQPAASRGIANVEKADDLNGNAGWQIQPKIAFPANEKILLRVSYSGGASKISNLFYVGPEASIAAADWYPALDDVRGTGELHFTVPVGETVIATGRRLSQEREEAQGKFRFGIDFPAFFSFASGKYKVVKGGGKNPVSAYLLSPRENIEAHLALCRNVLTALEAEFGAYPYPASGFPIIEMPSEVVGGLNGIALDGGFLVNGSFLDQEPNFRVYSHEISHEWWGHLISRKGAPGTAGDFMLDEAMAEFGFLLAAEALEGAEAAEQYRRTGYPGFEEDLYSSLGYLKLNAAGLDRRLAALPDENISGKLARGKGSRAWFMLRQEVGREKFRLTLREIARRYAYGSITWDEFLRQFEQIAGVNLEWFYDQWFERTGAPDWQLTSKQEDGILRGTITQNAPFYRASLEIEIKGNFAAERQKTVIEVRGARTEFSIPVKFKVRTVELDPRYLFLRWTPEYRAEATELSGYTRARNLLNEGKQDEAQAEIRKALERIPSPDLYGVRFLLENTFGAILISQKKWQDAKEHLEIAVASPSCRADVLPYAYLKLARVARELGDEMLLRRSVEAAISADAAIKNRSGIGKSARDLLRNSN